MSNNSNEIMGNEDAKTRMAQIKAELAELKDLTSSTKRSGTFMDKSTIPQHIQDKMRQDREKAHTANIRKPETGERILRGEFTFESGKLDFKCHTQNVSFSEVLEAITAMRDECQRQIDNQTKCPFHSQGK